MAVEVKVKFTSRRGLASEAMENGIERALEKIGLAAEAYTKRNLTRNGSVRTGNLRNSITYEVEGNAVTVGTAVYYAPFVEYGTRRARAKPYLRPAVEDHVERWQKIAEAEIDAALKIFNG